MRKRFHVEVRSGHVEDRRARARYEEGLMAYRQQGQGVYLHHYLTTKNTPDLVLEGDVTAAQNRTHFFVPFTVPDGVHRIHLQ